MINALNKCSLRLSPRLKRHLYLYFCGVCRLPGPCKASNFYFISFYRGLLTRAHINKYIILFTLGFITLASPSEVGIRKPDVGGRRKSRRSEGSEVEVGSRNSMLEMRSPKHKIKSKGGS